MEDLSSLALDQSFISSEECQFWKKRWIDYVTNHNVITIDHHGDEHFQNIKNGGRTRGNIGVKYSLLFRFHFDFSMLNYRKR